MTFQLFKIREFPTDSAGRGHGVGRLHRVIEKTASDAEQFLRASGNLNERPLLVFEGTPAATSLAGPQYLGLIEFSRN